MYLKLKKKNGSFEYRRVTKRELTKEVAEQLSSDGWVRTTKEDFDTRSSHYTSTVSIGTRVRLKDTEDGDKQYKYANGRKPPKQDTARDKKRRKREWIASKQASKVRKGSVASIAKYCPFPDIKEAAKDVLKEREITSKMDKESYKIRKVTRGSSRERARGRRV